MPNIDTYLRRIREATYGKNVREAIASGIEECYRQVSGNPEFYNSVASILGTDATATATRGQTIEDIGATVHAENGHLVFGFVLPKGDKGDKGDTGGIRAITLGTTETLDPDEQASVSVSYQTGADGEPNYEEPEFTFHIPKGIKGDKGNTGSVSSIRARVGEKLQPNELPTVNVSYENNDYANPIFTFNIPQGEPGMISNASGDTVNMVLNGEETIKQYVDTRSEISVNIEFTETETKNISDTRFTENHRLIGCQFYDSNGVATGKIIADLSWVTSSGLLRVDIDEVRDAGSAVLTFGWQESIDDNQEG